VAEHLVLKDFSFDRACRRIEKAAAKNERLAWSSSGPDAGSSMLSRAIWNACASERSASS